MTNQHNYQYVLERNFVSAISNSSKSNSYDDIMAVQVLGRKVPIRAQVSDIVQQVLVRKEPIRAQVRDIVLQVRDRKVPIRAQVSDVVM